MTAFDLAGIRTQLALSPFVEPWPFDLAVAVVNDVFRLGGEVHPPTSLVWLEWATQRRLLEEQVGMLAHLLAVTTLRDSSVATLGQRRRDGRGEAAPPAASTLLRFLDATAPLTAEMIRTNAFRQEEFVRRWVEALGGVVAGEDATRSARRLEQLDYRRTLAEYERAEGARRKEAAARAKALAEAAAREAAERGWRE